MAAFFWAAPRTRLTTSRRAAARRRRHPAAAAHTARHTRRTDRAQTAERLQTSDVRCIIGELHGDNTRVANLHASHALHHTHERIMPTRGTHHNIGDAWLQQLHHCFLTLTRALQESNMDVTDQCRNGCSTGTCMNAATEGDVLTPCARQRTPAADVTQGTSTIDKDTALCQTLKAYLRPTAPKISRTLRLVAPR
jgi:ferredoxin